MKKTKRLLFAICLLIVSATLLGTASYAWFSMNTEVNVDGIRVEAYSDSLFLEISKTGADDEFATNVDFTSKGEVALRLAKHGFVGDKVYTIVAEKANGNYAGTVPTNGYYKLIAATSDSFQKYVKAEVNVDYKLGTSLVGLYEELVFNKQTSGKAATGVTYYELVAGKYVPAELTVGASDIKGYYTLTGTPTAIATESCYAGDKQYYAKGTDGSYSNVTATLELGTDLSAFYTIDATEVASTAALGDVYLAKTGNADNEYAFLGKYDTATDISEALYFGRAYSDVIANGDQTDTLNILKNLETAKGTYFYKETVYLRNAENTNNSKNLTATIKVGGTVNEIAKALRVLLVVTDFTSGTPGARVNTVYYDNVDGIVYGDGETNIVDVLLGNKAETLQVEIYVYFDGTDEIAENSKIEAGILDGQTVSIAFNVDDHAYNKPVTP